MRLRVVLPRNVSHPALLQALAERTVSIFSFEPIKPDLEAAFWQLANSEFTDESKQRRAA